MHARGHGNETEQLGKYCMVRSDWGNQTCSQGHGVQVWHGWEHLMSLTLMKLFKIARPNKSFSYKTKYVKNLNIFRCPLSAMSAHIIISRKTVMCYTLISTALVCQWILYCRYVTRGSRNLNKKINLLFSWGLGTDIQKHLLTFYWATAHCRDYCQAWNA